jgi:hypothetical protein
MPSSSARPASVLGTAKPGLYRLLRRLGCWSRALFYDARVDLKAMG